MQQKKKHTQLYDGVILLLHFFCFLLREGGVCPFWAQGEQVVLVHMSITP